LIADSSTVDRQTLSRRLAAEGFEVIQAQDGAEAVSAVRCHQPGLVILNTSFPPDVGHGGGAFGDAFLVIDWLKRMEEAEGIGIILITSEEASSLKDRARASGALGLFQKPVNQEALLDLVHRLLNPAPPPE